MNKPRTYAEIVADDITNRDRGTCWYWYGPLTRQGHGRITIKGRSTTTHRYAAELDGNNIDGLIVRQDCGFVDCYNPDHFTYLTTTDIGAEARTRNRIEREAQCRALGRHYRRQARRTS